MTLTRKQWILVGILSVIFFTLFWNELLFGEMRGPSARSVTFSVGKYDGEQFDSFMQYSLPPYDLENEYLQHMTQITADFDLVCVGDTYSLNGPSDACVYLDNSIFGKSTQKQYRYVSWEFEIGLSLQETVDLFYHHKSEHMMDTSRPDHFPISNYFGIRIEFIPDARKLRRYR